MDIYIGKGVLLGPLDQFEIKDFLSVNAPVLGNFRLSFSSIGFYLIINVLIVLILNNSATNYNKIVSNTWSLSQESIYATIHSVVINQINTKKQFYFPFIYALFLFILVNNLIGMVPYSFASTSHFILTFSISFTIVLGATLLGFNKYGLEFFSLFVPAGCPLTLLPLLVLIEFISSLARNVSLGLRLAANIVAGHLLLNILSGFTYNIITTRVSPPKPYAFVSLPLQSTFYSIFIIKIYKFFLDLLKYLFLSVFKNIRFSTSGSVVSYKGINITLNPFIFRLLFFTCLFFSLILVYSEINTIINEIIQDPWVWFNKYIFALLSTIIISAFSSILLDWLKCFNAIRIKHGFDYACEVVFIQQVYIISICRKEIFSLYLCLLLVVFNNSWLIMPLLLLTSLLVCNFSVLTLIYINFIDKEFKNKNPVLYHLLVITCFILIAFCLLLSIYLTIIIVKEIKSYLLNMNTSGNSSNNPQKSSNPSGSTGSGGGGGPNKPGGGNENPFTIDEKTLKDMQRKARTEHQRSYRKRKRDALAKTNTEQQQETDPSSSQQETSSSEPQDLEILKERVRTEALELAFLKESYDQNKEALTRYEKENPEAEVSETSEKKAYDILVDDFYKSGITYTRLEKIVDELVKEVQKQDPNYKIHIDRAEDRDEAYN